MSAATQLLPTIVKCLAQRMFGGILEAGTIAITNGWRHDGLPALRTLTCLACVAQQVVAVFRTQKIFKVVLQLNAATNQLQLNLVCDNGVPAVGSLHTCAESMPLPAGNQGCDAECGTLGRFQLTAAAAAAGAVKPNGCSTRICTEHCSEIIKREGQLVHACRPKSLEAWKTHGIKVRLKSPQVLDCCRHGPAWHW